jgi:hypothetical protein
MPANELDFGDPIDTTYVCCGTKPLSHTSDQALTCPTCRCEIGVREQQVAWLTYCPKHYRPVGT